MVKRINGLFQDCDPVDQPEGTYRDALNANVNKEFGAVVSEKGNNAFLGIPEDHKVIGHVLIHDGRKVVFSVGPDNSSQIGVIKENSYIPLLNGTEGQVLSDDEFPQEEES